METDGRILKENLSWTREQSNSSEAKIFSFVFISFFFALKATLQILKFELCQIKLG